jgi:cytochrome c oxidase subunit 2
MTAFFFAVPFLSPTNIFAPVSTPAQSVLDLSLFVLEVTAAIFLVVFSLLAYAVVKFRKRTMADGREPAQVYGSSQLELAWTVQRRFKAAVNWSWRGRLFRCSLW